MARICAILLVMPAFTAKVIDCFTRHQPKAAGLTCKVFGFDANWIVVLDVTSSEEGAPFAVGRANMLIHSPTQTFFYSAEEIPGMTFRFEASRKERGWWLDRTSCVDAPG